MDSATAVVLHVGSGPGRHQGGRRRCAGDRFLAYSGCLHLAHYRMERERDRRFAAGTGQKRRTGMGYVPFPPSASRTDAS